jgi:hypothetical protein
MTETVKTTIGEGWSDEMIHGDRHMQRVRDEAEVIVGYIDTDPRLAKLVVLASEIHDLGRLGLAVCFGIDQIDPNTVIASLSDEPTGVKNHARLSAELFRLMSIVGLSKKEKDAVYFAVRHHDIGLVGLGIPRARSLAEKILGLLVLADHADAASAEGAARSAMALGKLPIHSQRFSHDHLVLFLSETGEECPLIPVAAMNDYKSDSLLAHWVYNHQATWPIWRAVEHLLPRSYFRGRLLPRQQQFQALIQTHLVSFDQSG